MKDFARVGVILLGGALMVGLSVVFAGCCGLALDAANGGQGLHRLNAALRQMNSGCPCGEHCGCNGCCPGNCK